MFTLSKPEDSLTKKEIVTVPASGLLADLYELGQAWGFQQCLTHKKNFNRHYFRQEIQIPNPISKSNNFQSGASITMSKLKAQLWREYARYSEMEMWIHLHRIVHAKNLLILVRLNTMITFILADIISWLAFSRIFYKKSMDKFSIWKYLLKYYIFFNSTWNRYK